MSSYVIDSDILSVSNNVAFCLFSSKVLRFEHSIKSLPLVSLSSRGMHFTFYLQNNRLLAWQGIQEIISHSVSCGRHYWYFGQDDPLSIVTVPNT